MYSSVIFSLANRITIPIKRPETSVEHHEHEHGRRRPRRTLHKWLKSVVQLVKHHPGISQYCYTSLPTKSSFRVLELLPGNHDAEIAYRLHLADWNSPPSYEAISYAWGDTKAKVATLCENRAVEVTPNLRDGLRRMRFIDRPRVLWADAVCIDQHNSEEREHQVSNMRLIYNNATKVIVWLGEDEDDQTQRAVEFMSDIALRCCEHRNFPIAQLSSRDDLWRITPDVPFDDIDQSEHWRNLAWFLGRAWFSRLWVFQEVNSGTDVDVLCGSIQLAWDVVALAAAYIRSFPKIYSKQCFEDSLHQNAYVMRNRRFHASFTIPRLLQWSKVFVTSDPLDRVYALLATPPFVKMDPPLEVNYQASRLELYREVTRRCILDQNNLEVLECVQHSGKIDESFPSWVPQWDHCIHQNPINLPEFWSWEASAAVPPKFNVDHLNSTLELNGNLLDAIVSETKIDNWKWFDVENTTLYSHPILEYWSAQNECPTTYINGESNCMVYSMVLACGLTKGLANHSTKAMENKTEFVASFSAYLLRLLHHSGYMKYGKEELAKLHEEAGTRLGSWSKYENGARNGCYNRSFFTTKKGYMGLGSNALQNGDLVCVLFGGRVPFILRPTNGYYLLVGEAYVHGIMEGEAIKQWQAGDLKEQVFEIH